MRYQHVVTAEVMVNIPCAHNLDSTDCDCALFGLAEGVFLVGEFENGDVGVSKRTFSLIDPVDGKQWHYADLSKESQAVVDVAAIEAWETLVLCPTQGCKSKRLLSSATHCRTCAQARRELQAEIITTMKGKGDGRNNGGSGGDSN